MESFPLVKTSAVLLILTALGGIAMALYRTRAGRPPDWLAMAHGMLATAGLTLLLWAAFTVGIPAMMWAGLAVLFAMSLLGLYMNLGFHAKFMPLPIGPLVVRALGGAAGLFIIALGAFGGPPQQALAGAPPASAAQQNPSAANSPGARPPSPETAPAIAAATGAASAARAAEAASGTAAPAETGAVPSAPVGPESLATTPRDVRPQATP